MCEGRERTPPGPPLDRNPPSVPPRASHATPTHRAVRAVKGQAAAGAAAVVRARVVAARAEGLVPVCIYTCVHREGTAPVHVDVFRCECVTVARQR